ncbi:hypothetical protein DPK04_19920 [Salmonella enterica subsp. enterica serovar Mikawasima]|nr:hypothetical protein [Salmonella enterica subsp. enterica serovar Mikawasima]EBK3292271.1 hypothetical protein [Salmonella enterica]ECP4666997.1 hypothetical protein [Salmonella enterica subsp. enterica serovar Newport]EBS4044918.1 hypothetical protein [Salmonella enterica subsp. enterica serovar Mikawasima]EBX4240713.1 hypothetical protein [Salmonella enterica subsp. enterica serovar Mikawasima]
MLPRFADIFQQGNEVTFSLSYELLTQKAEEEIRNINLDQDGTGYIEALAKASAILNFWYGLALQGYPGSTMDEHVDADRLRLHALVFKRED